MVLGVGGSNSTICGSIKSKMAADSHLGMMALSRVTLASAGLSWFLVATTLDNRQPMTARVLTVQIKLLH